MKLQKLPDCVQQSFKSGYIKNRVKIISTVIKGRHKIFTYKILKGMGRGKIFTSNLNLTKV